MNPRTATLLQRIGVRHPIFQAPMAGVSSPAMAAAVSEAGGLGALGLGAAGVDVAAKMIADLRSRTLKPFHVNVFAHKLARARPAREAAWIERWRPEFKALHAQPPRTLHEIYKSFVADDEMLAMLIEVKPTVVSLHFGLASSDRIAALRGAGILVFASVTSLAEGRQAARVGVDALIAQGYEAGGHRGVFDPEAVDDRIGTLALTRVLSLAIDLPVIAAGGVMDGAGIRAVLTLGAAAAQLGTAFVATRESLADEGYRAALFSDDAHHTVMTRAISGRPARCLPNVFTALGEKIPSCAVPDYPIAYDLGKALHAAGKRARVYGFGAQWAGQGAPLARCMSAGDLTRTLVAEAG